MRSVILLTFSLLMSYSAIAQNSNCQELVKENDYLKVSLGIVQSKAFETNTDGLTVKSVQCINNSITKMAIVEILITNVTDVDRKLEFGYKDTDVIDLQGNSYTVIKRTIGDAKDADNVLFYLTYILPPKVPIKLRFYIQNLPKEITLLKLAQTSLRKNNSVDYIQIYGKDISVVQK